MAQVQLLSSSPNRDFAMNATLAVALRVRRNIRQFVTSQQRQQEFRTVPATQKAIEWPASHINSPTNRPATGLPANENTVTLTAMNNAKQIIERFGGQSSLAGLIGKRQSTVQHWVKTGRIPAQWHPRLLEVAREQGIALEPRDFVSIDTPEIQPAGGKLGVLLVGLGAVSSTFIAGVEHIRQGTGQPIGSLSQMATIRLGKRPDHRTPLIRDFVPLAGLDQLVFGAWDPIPDNAYEAALKCGALDRHDQIEPIAPFLKSIEPMPAVFDTDYVKRIDGVNVQPAMSKLQAVEAVREQIRRFRDDHGCDRLVMAWCASTEKFITETETHQDIERFRCGLRDNDESIAPSMIYAYAGLMEGIPFINGAPNLTVDIPALECLAKETGSPVCGKDFKTGQTLVKTVIGPMLKARMLGMDGWFSTNILGNRDGEVLDEPRELQDQGGVEARRARAHPSAGYVPRALLRRLSQGAHQLLPAPRRRQGGLGQRSTCSAGSRHPMQLKINFLCSDSILAAPLVLDLVLFMDLAQSVRAWSAYRSGSPSTSRVPTTPLRSTRNTTSSSNRPSSRTR